MKAEVQAALNLLIERRGSDLDHRLDLNGTDLAYVKLPNQRLDNVNFDGSLLCRVIIVGSVFTGSTFGGATLRYAVFTNAVGLEAAELRTSYSLCGTVLPVSLRADRGLRKLEATDPEPHLLCAVT